MVDPFALRAEAEALFEAGLQSLREGADQPAARAFAAAHERFVQLGDLGRAATAAGNKAAIDLENGRPVEAASSLREVMTTLTEQGLVVAPELEINFARALWRLGQVSEALERSARAALSAREQSHPIAEGAAWSLRAEILESQGKLTEALPALEDAARAYEIAGQMGEAARMWLALGGAGWVTGNKPVAAAAHVQALEVMREHAGAEDIVSALVNLGGIYYHMQDHRLALVALEEALERLTPELRGTFLETRLRANRGLALIVVGQFDDARADLEHAREGYRAAGQYEGLARQVATMSNLCRYEGDVAKAVELQREVMELENTHGFRVAEPGGLLYSALEDRSLNIFAPDENRDRVAGGGRQFAPAETDAVFSLHASRFAHGGERPVVFIAPPAYGAFGPIFPRGVTAVASYLNQHGIPALVVPLGHYVDDFHGAEDARARTLEVLRDVISALKPRAFGMGATFSYLYPRACEIARMVRTIDPSIPIVIGGAHVTYQDKECLEEAPEIDVVVRGEGEWTAYELFAALESKAPLEGILGITWRDAQGVIHKNPNRKLGNVPDLPEVDFTLLPEGFLKKMEVSALTSRGCTFRCKYCHEYRYWGGIVREHAIEHIVNEMETVARYGNRLQGIDDSMLNMTNQYYFDLVDALGKSDALPENFGFLTRLDTITPDGLKAMTKVGIRSLSVGAESGSQKVLDAMNKGLKVEQTGVALQNAKDAGVSVNAFFIIGHPGDDNTESETTLNFIGELFERDIVTWTDLSIFTPYPGTPFYSMPKTYGVEILSKDWSLWRRSNRPIAQLETYKANQIYLNYLRTLELQERYMRRRSAAAK